MTPRLRRGPILCVLLAGACPSTEVPRESGPDPDRSGLEARADRPRLPDLAGDLARPDVKPCDDPGVVVAPGVTVRPTQLAPGGQATIVYQAPAKLAAAANLSLHYGFNYWAAGVTGTVATDVAMTKRSDGAHEVTVSLPAAARLLDFVFFTSGQTTEWDNNGGADYRRSTVGTYLGPYLSLRDNLAGQPDRDPAHGIVVSFKSDHPCVGRVRFGTGALTGAVEGSGSATMHHLALTGLAADAAYQYEVECQSVGSCSAERSPTYSFRTAPQSPASLSFVHLSDAQPGGDSSHWASAAAQLMTPAHAGVRFLVFTGDHAANDVPAYWWQFFDKGRALLASKAIVPAVGNHDVSTGTTATFDALFDLQSSSGINARYGLRYGPASFLVLNSQTSATDWKPGGSHYVWVQSALPKLAAPGWRFAAWHIPPYNAGSRHAGQQGDVRPITQLFDDTVDWVLSGHEHLYQRTLPIRHEGKLVSTYGGPGGGVGYLVTPAVGADPSGDLLAEGSPERARLAYPGLSVVGGGKHVWNGFVQITLQGKTIQIQAYALGETTPRDAVSYTKP